MSEDNPYSSSSAPVAAEEVPPSRLRFYFICLACALLLLACLFSVTNLQLPPYFAWIGMACIWMVGNVWVLRPEAKAAGGLRNLRMGRVLVVVCGVAIFTPVLMFLLVMAGAAVFSYFMVGTI